MAFTFATRGLYHLLANAISSSTDIRMIVFKGTVPSTAAIRDFNTVADATGSTLDEAAASGYTRANTQLNLTITGPTETDASDSVTITATAPVLTSVAAGETWSAVGYYVYNGGADSTQDLIGIDVPTPATLATNGEDVTLPALSITITGS